MANAKKCDRCGRCFDPMKIVMPMARFRNPMFQKAKDIQEGTMGELLISDHPADIVDLCPDCAHQFRLFMKGWNIAYNLEECDDFEEAVKQYCEGRE